MAGRNNKRNSGIRMRADVDLTLALKAAQVVIGRLEQEVSRLGSALDTQRTRYERTLASEREERSALLRGRGKRTRDFVAEIDVLRGGHNRLTQQLDAARWSERRASAEKMKLQTELNQSGAAYRASLGALRRSFEQQIGQAPSQSEVSPTSFASGLRSLTTAS